MFFNYIGNKNCFKRGLFFLFMMANVAVLNAQARGLEVVARSLGVRDIAIGRQIAVIVGIDKYKEWTPLKNPVKDARELKKILEDRYHFDEFYELYDDKATAVGMRSLFLNLIDTVGPTDSVLIYYAGHGYTDRLQTGYWIPVDGGKDLLAQERWISNSQIRNFMTQMQARSVVLFADACFSGDLLSLSRGAPPEINDGYFRNALRYNARQVLTSGASESVPDESEFSKQLKTFLRTNTDPYIDPYLIYDRVRRGVSSTMPLFGTLPGQEEGGSFVLFLNSGSEAKTAVDPATSASTSVRVVGGGVASLAIASNPSGADIFLDGKHKGTTPALLENLQVGKELMVEVRLEQSYASSYLVLEEGKTFDLNLVLEKLKGNLFIEKQIDGFMVMIDGVPQALQGNVIKNIDVGMHTVSIQNESSFMAWVDTVGIDEAKTTRIKPEFVTVGFLRMPSEIADDGAVVIDSTGKVSPGHLIALTPGEHQISVLHPEFEPDPVVIKILPRETAVFDGKTLKYSDFGKMNSLSKQLDQLNLDLEIQKARFGYKANKTGKTLMWVGLPLVLIGTLVSENDTTGGILGGMIFASGFWTWLFTLESAKQVKLSQASIIAIEKELESKGP